MILSDWWLPRQLVISLPMLLVFLELYKEHDVQGMILCLLYAIIKHTDIKTNTNILVVSDVICKSLKYSGNNEIAIIALCPYALL